jgi:voltage-gated potassium channel
MSHSLREAARKSGRIVYLEVVVLLLSLFSLGALLVELLLPLDAELLKLLQRTDDIVCGIFLADFLVHFWLAPSKKLYLRWGWIDLLSSLPAVPWVRWARVFRVFRIVRAIRSFRTVAANLFENRAQGTFGVVGLLSMTAVLFATMAVLELEQGAPGANIHTAGDALWWAFATITTIGYGDRFPVTIGGRIVAVVLVVFGLSFFGTFTAYVASFFLEKAQLKEESEILQLTREVRRLRERLERMETETVSGAKEPGSRRPEPD